MMIYIPEPTDSIITGNEVTKKKITINGVDVIDIKEGITDQSITINGSEETLEGMRIYTLTMDEKTLGKIMVRTKGSIIENKDTIDIIDPISYGKTKVFSEGSTNRPGIGIYVQSSAFSKEGYDSIEDSTDPMLGIGFTNDFKNIANFANGKAVGEATLPYGSQFMINF